MEPITAIALFVKMIPYVLGVKVVTSAVDVGVHWIKSRIGRNEK